MRDRPTQIRISFLLIALTAVMLAGGDASANTFERNDADKRADTDSRGMVLPARRSVDQRFSGKMTAEANAALKNLGYDLVSVKAQNSILQRANPANVERCYDQAMLAIGRAVKADLIVCPRIVSQPRRAVQVTFARVSKKRIWNCRQPIEPGEAGHSDAYTDAVTFCMDQLLSSAPETAGKARTKKTIVITPKKKAHERKNYLGVEALLVPAGAERFTGYAEDQRFSKHINYDFSWGVGVLYERRNISFVAVGAEFAWHSLGRKNLRSSEEGEAPLPWEAGSEYANTPGQLVAEVDRLNLFSLAATLRFLYPGKWVEPYLKLGLGFSVGAARDGELYNEVETGAGFGANYQVRAGIMAILSYAGLFVEIGFVDAMWFPSTAAYVEFETAMLNEALLSLNIGLVAVF